MKTPTAAIIISGVAAVNAADRVRRRFWWCGLVAAIAWLVVAAVTRDGPMMAMGRYQRARRWRGGVRAVFAWCRPREPLSRPAAADPGAGPWLIALAFALGAWEVSSAKLHLLPLPFFASPQALLEVYIDDWPRLGESRGARSRC